MREVVILVGIPGSGKSTYADIYFDDYIIVSQDDAGGSRKQMQIDFLYALENTDKSIIIDRTNISKKQREYFIKKIQQKEDIEKIRCINFIADTDQCIKRIQERQHHPTIKEDTPIDKIQQIVYNFIKSYEKPELSEGFSEILHINSESIIKRNDSGKIKNRRSRHWI